MLTILFLDGYIIALNCAERLDMEEAARYSKSLEFIGKEFPGRGGSYA